MWAKEARQDRSCSLGFSWYICAKGDYAGCCSTDPCDSGVCPDDLSSSVSTLTTVTATVKATAEPTTNTQPASSTSSQTSISSVISLTTFSSVTTSTGSSIASVTTPETTSQESGLTTVIVTASVSAPAQTSESTPSTPNNSGRIGGIVGGVVGAVAILTLIVFCIWRYKRKTKRPSPSTWQSANDDKSMVDLQSHITGPGVDHRNPFADFGGNYASAKTIPIETSINNCETIPDNGNARPTRRLDSPAAAAGVGSLPLSLSTLHEEKESAELPELPGTTPSRTELTPELPDTPSPRVRAELPAVPERSLINVPSPQIGSNSEGRANSLQNNTTRNTVTREGILMQSNMNSFFNEEAGIDHSAQPNHALDWTRWDSIDNDISFMASRRIRQQVSDVTSNGTSSGRNLPVPSVLQVGQIPSATAESDERSEMSPELPKIFIRAPSSNSGEEGNDGDLNAHPGWDEYPSNGPSPSESDSQPQATVIGSSELPRSSSESDMRDSSVPQMTPVSPISPISRESEEQEVHELNTEFGMNRLAMDQPRSPSSLSGVSSLSTSQQRSIGSLSAVSSLHESP